MVCHTGDSLTATVWGKVVGMSTNNRQWRVAGYPRANEPVGLQHFDWTSESMPEPADGEFLVRTICLAPGPAQRGYLEKSQSAFFGEPIPVGDIMRGRGVGEIVASNHPDYQPGEIFLGSLGWQDYSVQKPIGSEFVFSTRKISKPRYPLSLHLGILGQAGGTAYFGLLEGADIKHGDNVLISAAAGGVGSVAGQVARNMGAASVIGIAGSTEKCAWLCDELGYNAAINYKNDNLDKKLSEYFPDGIDVFLDNVGGEILNTALAHLALNARVAISGFISTQYSAEQPTGPANYPNLLFKRARMQGFVYFDYWDRYEEAEQQLCNWYDQGTLKDTEHPIDGLEKMPQALADLFSGNNRGISICRVSPDKVG
jgi:NADPH-dependent curcumin reductase CurA